MNRLFFHNFIKSSTRSLFIRKMSILFEKVQLGNLFVDFFLFLLNFNYIGGDKGDLIAKNRIVLAPLTRGRCGQDEMPGKPHHVEYYRQRATAGLEIVEATSISLGGVGWDEAPGIYNDDQVIGWKKVTDAVHEEGGIIFSQLWHMGRATHSSIHGIQPVSASAIKADGTARARKGFRPQYELPRALETSEVIDVIEEYRKAAENAKKAGFDGVEIHSANGYLIEQFLQSVSNVRTDQYGGSIENRFRFLKEIFEAVLTIYPVHRIAVRISPNGSSKSMGSDDYYETFAYALTYFNNYNLAYFHIMDGLSYGSFHNKGKPFRIADVRKFYQGVLMGNSGYTKEKAEGAIETGTVDLIAFGRPFIGNPDLVDRFRNDYPLTEAQSSTFFDYPEGHPEIGYTDFPTYKAV